MKKIMAKGLIILIMSLCICALGNITVYADFEEDIISEFDFSDMEEFINNDDDLKDIEFKEIINEFMKGDAQKGFEKILSIMYEILLKNLVSNKDILKRIVIITILAAVFTNFSKILKNNQVSEMGFTVCYMMIISFLAVSFNILSMMASATIEKMVDFMKALLPVYIVTVGVSDGQTAASTYYQVALVVITIIEVFCLKVLLPAMNLYVVITIINNIHKEDYMSKICEMIKNGVTFAIKGMLTVVTGLNVIRQMFTPVNSGIGINASKNVLGLMSGAGKMGSSLTELVYGTGNILKNSIGGVGLIVLSIIILIPIVKMVIYIFMYQITNVLVQPVSDKRIIACLDGVTKGAVLLLRIVFSVSLMFVITIAIVCINNG